MIAVRNEIDIEHISERFHQLCKLYYARILVSIERYYDNNRAKYFEKAVYKCIRDLQAILQTTINLWKEIRIDSKEILKLDLLRESYPEIFFYFYDDVAAELPPNTKFMDCIKKELLK